MELNDNNCLPARQSFIQAAAPLFHLSSSVLMKMHFQHLLAHASPYSFIWSMLFYNWLPLTDLTETYI